MNHKTEQATTKTNEAPVVSHHSRKSKINFYPKGVCNYKENGVVRPEGLPRKTNWYKNKSKHHSLYICNCPCGKSSGVKKNIKARDLWVRLHKKTCKLTTKK